MKMSLAIAPIGKEVRITRLSVDDTLKKHLADLGVLLNQVVTPMIANSGNLVIKVRDSRLAINKKVAMQIFVQ